MKFRDRVSILSFPYLPQAPALSVGLLVIVGVLWVPTALANDGFSGAYQPPIPQQWQPIAPQQGYGQVSQQQTYNGSQNYAQQNSGQSPGNGMSNGGYDGSSNGGSSSWSNSVNFSGYASTEQALPQQSMPQQPYSGQSGQSYGQGYGQGYGQSQPYGANQNYGTAPGLSGQNQYYGGQMQTTAGDGSATNLDQTANTYFNQLDQDSSRQSSSRSGSAAEQTSASGGGKMEGVKKVGKILAGVGGTMAAGYLMNKAIQKNPRLLGGYGAPYGNGYGMAPYGGGYGMAPYGNGYGSAPYGGGYGMSPYGNGYGMPYGNGGMNVNPMSVLNNLMGR